MMPKGLMGTSAAAQRPNARSARTPPFAGLLAGLRLGMGVGTREADTAALDGVADWNAVAALARRHRVGSLLLRGVSAVADPSPDAKAALEPFRQHRMRRGLRQLADLREATDRLAASGIPSLVLKGLPLSVRLFGTPLARDCIDIDLLVPREQAAEAAQALASGGWRLVKPSFHPTPARIRHYDRFVKDRLFIGPHGMLELHHRLVNNPFLLRASFETLSASAVSVEIGGHAFASLGDGDLMVYLAIHGQLHRWSRLKWLCDMAALLASMDEDRLVAAVERCRREGLRLEPAFGAALLLCSEMFHVDPPAAFPPPGAWAGRAMRSTRRLWNRPHGGKGLEGLDRRMDELWLGQAMNPSWRSAAHELARLCVAPYDLGRVDLPDRLFFLYLPLRPILWLASRLERNRKRSGQATTRRGGTGRLQVAGDAKEKPKCPVRP